MTLAEFGAIHGVSKQAAEKWKKRGWIVLKDGDIDVEASNKKLKKYRKPRAIKAVNKKVDGQKVDKKLSVRPGETPAQAADRIMVDVDVTMNVEEAKRIKESYLALLNQLEYDTKSGLVVMAADVAREVGQEYAKVRTRLLSIPSEQAPQIHRLKTVAEVQDALLACITEVLEELKLDAL
jgi:hypothetical protein